MTTIKEDQYYEIKKDSYSATELKAILDARGTLIEEYMLDSILELEDKYSDRSNAKHLHFLLLLSSITVLLALLFVKAFTHLFFTDSRLFSVFLVVLFGVAYTFWSWLLKKEPEQKTEAEHIITDFWETWKDFGGFIKE